MSTTRTAIQELAMSTEKGIALGSVELSEVKRSGHVIGTLAEVFDPAGNFTGERTYLAPELSNFTLAGKTFANVNNVGWFRQDIDWTNDESGNTYKFTSRGYSDEQAAEDEAMMAKFNAIGIPVENEDKGFLTDKTGEEIATMVNDILAETAKPVTYRLTITGPNVPCQIHAAGCKDLNNRKFGRNDDEKWTEDFSSWEDVAVALWGDIASDELTPGTDEWRATCIDWMSEYKVMSCCPKLPDTI